MADASRYAVSSRDRIIEETVCINPPRGVLLAEVLIPPVVVRQIRKLLHAGPMRVLLCLRAVTLGGHCGPNGALRYPVRQSIAWALKTAGPSEIPKTAPAATTIRTTRMCMETPSGTLRATSM